MPISYVLKQAGSKMGLNPSAQTSRNTLLRFLNEAALELYDQSDAPGSVFEQVFKVNGNQTVSLPMYVGEIRAAREANSQVAWSINQLRPRYNQFSWPDQWRNLRLKNTSCLQCTVTNQSVVTITVPSVETPPIVVTIAGPTEEAAEASESIVMDGTAKITVNQYLDIVSVKKDRVNNCDVAITDVDGKTLTVIPNNAINAIYQIVDVSTCPWLQASSSALEHYLEILYKKRLPWFSNDSDEYIDGSYDNILVNKMLQLWAEEQGKGDVAQGYDAKATRSLARRTENRNRETEDKVALTNNPHDTLLPRVRSGVGKYRYWRGRMF